VRRLASVGVARPRLMLGIWFAVIGVLALIGLGVEDGLHRTNPVVGGSQSAQEDRLAREHFGDSQTLIALLSGPRAALDRQGPALVRRLDRRPRVSVVSPWMRDAPAMRPGATKALLIIRVDRSFDDTSKHDAPAIRDELEEHVRPPLRASLTGYTDVGVGTETATLDALRRAELIAAPLLMIVLLLVFRSPFAAAIPLLLGFTTIAASRGLIALLNDRLVAVDAIALNIGSMFALALGVDYALLMVSRFREEMQGGRETRAAAYTAAVTSGRTVAFAGFALAAMMLAGLLLAPARVLASGSVGGIAAVTLSVFAAATALPALLTLLGPRLNRTSWGGGQRTDGGLGQLAWRLVSRPALAAALVLVLLAALSAPALGLSLSSPTSDILPASVEQRRDADAIGKALGKGWIAPYEVLIATDEGTVTEPARLAAISKWQNDIMSAGGVEAIFGPATLQQSTRALRRVPGQLTGARKAVSNGQRNLGRLTGGLRRASDGTELMRRGLRRASAGAGQLSTGAAAASSGSRALADGTESARKGSVLLYSGLRQTRGGMQELRAGVAQARTGTRRLRSGLHTASTRVGQALPRARELKESFERARTQLKALQPPVDSAEDNLQRGIDLLETMSPASQSEPQYQAARERLTAALDALSGGGQDGDASSSERQSVGDGVTIARGQARVASFSASRLVDQTIALTDGIERLADGSVRLDGGLGKLDRGADRLLTAFGQLDGGGARLTSGLGRIAAGTDLLARRLNELRQGAGQLAGGLGGSDTRVARLTTGLDRMRTRAVAFRTRTARLGRSLAQARRLGSALRSGYFTLAILDTANPARRDQAGFTVNASRGGDAARVTIVETADEIPVRPGRPVRARLESSARRLEDDTGMRVAVGGVAPLLQDFTGATQSRLPLLILVLSVVTFVILVVILRSLVIPALTVLLTVLTVGAGLGVLVLLFEGSNPLLGGSGFIDSIMAPAVTAIAFGLAIDYEVFLLSRMREGYLLTGSVDGGVSYALTKTAAVITGAALIMTAVFIAFSSAGISNMRQFGIGLTVAVILDATVVRLILLPAIVRLVGDRAWWLPTWLDRLLPRLPEDAA
jgi:putative drug exporter of the RND superfamily